MSKSRTPLAFVNSLPQTQTLNAILATYKRQEKLLRCRRRHLQLVVAAVSSVNEKLSLVDQDSA
jgi:hypothetical protein